MVHYSTNGDVMRIVDNQKIVCVSEAFSEFREILKNAGVATIPEEVISIISEMETLVEAWLRIAPVGIEGMKSHMYNMITGFDNMNPEHMKEQMNDYFGKQMADFDFCCDFIYFSALTVYHAVGDPYKHPGDYSKWNKDTAMDWASQNIGLNNEKIKKGSKGEKNKADKDKNNNDDPFSNVRIIKITGKGGNA